MGRKIAIVILMIGLITIHACYAEKESDFKDHWAVKEIEKFIQSDYVELINNEFRPDDPMTRGEFTDLVNNVFNLNETSEKSFNDMSKDSTYFEDALIARKAGYITGYEDNTFRPDKSISRQEVAKILCSIMELEETSKNVVKNFNDYNDVPTWSKASINTVLEEGYFGGYPDNTFKPSNNVKRAEAVVIVNNILHAKPSEDIYKYRDLADINEPRLNRFELMQLREASAEEIQAQVNTVADVLQYMKFVDYQTRSGDNEERTNGISWSFNNSALEVITTNIGNCGGTSNMVNYLLREDYEEVGFIHFIAGPGQGGHVYNYIKHSDKYYIIDFLQYPLKDYDKYEYDIVSVDSLEKYPPYCIDNYERRDRKIKLIVATNGDAAINHLPIGIAYKEKNQVSKYYPKQYIDSIQSLYETPSEEIVLKFIKGPSVEDLK